MKQVSRTVLKEAIQEAVDHSKIEDPLRSDLLAVAATAKRVTVGTFAQEGVGCPLYQAGIHSDDEDEPWIDKDQITLFFAHFDPYMDRVLGHASPGNWDPSYIVEIID